MVVPRFKRMLEEMEAEGQLLPLDLSFSSYLPVIGLAALVLLLAVVAVSLPFPTMRGRIGRLLAPLASFTSTLRWHMPLFSRYERRRAISRYALAAGTLIEAGVPTHEALRISATASGTRHFDRIALAAAEAVTEGHRISEAMRTADIRGELPDDFLWYIEVGESSEDLAGAFSRAAETSAVRSRSALGGLVKLIAPASILLPIGLSLPDAAERLDDAKLTVTARPWDSGPGLRHLRVRLGWRGRSGREREVVRETLVSENQIR
jgi:type II secretory pathway component PulF